MKTSPRFFVELLNGGNVINKKEKTSLFFQFYDYSELMNLSNSQVKVIIFNSNKTIEKEGLVSHNTIRVTLTESDRVIEYGEMEIKFLVFQAQQLIELPIQGFQRIRIIPQFNDSGVNHSSILSVEINKTREIDKNNIKNNQYIKENLDNEGTQKQEKIELIDKQKGEERKGHHHLDSHLNSLRINQVNITPSNSQSYKKRRDDIVNLVDNKEGTSNNLNVTQKKDINTVNVKMFGAKGDGVTDDTSSIQKTIDYASDNKIKEVFVPDGIYMIDCLKYINLKDNTTLHLASKAQLRAIPNASNRYYMINIEDCSGVTVYGGNLKGERDSHKGTEGEWGYGVRIAGSINVEIRDIKIEKFWGDGIAIVGHKEKYSQYVTIDNVISDSNRRQGISIIRGKDIYVLNSILSNTRGTPPQAGIDIEPDLGMPNAERITIEGCKSFGNGGAGIMVAFNVQETRILDNSLYENQLDGIFIVGESTIERQPSNIIAEGNLIYNNQRSGIRLEQTSSISLKQNTLERNMSRGISVYKVNSSNIVSNVIRNNSSNGVYVTDSSNKINICKNFITNNAGSFQVILRNKSSYCRIVENTISGESTYGILINDETVTNNLVSDNDLTLFKGSVKILDQGLNTVINNGTKSEISVAEEPVEGVWEKAHILYNLYPNPGGYIGWICTVAGTANKCPWVPNKEYTRGQKINSDYKVYEALNSGRTGLIPPTETRNSIVDGTIIWRYIDNLAHFKRFGSIEH
ncbi:right-handed parallel beta-helix repeat-containing protein [Priestia filamentosa]|uniref:right-handed parallel beta-helix repeat-containing protein n=1 Tax=Priestia filamentosa TaxID=1402861 RepID=UPI003982D959